MVSTTRIDISYESYPHFRAELSYREIGEIRKDEDRHFRFGNDEATQGINKFEVVIVSVLREGGLIHPKKLIWMQNTFSRDTAE